MSDDAIVMTDARGVIQFWNEAATTLFGYDSKEALGQSLDIIVGEDFREAHWSGFRAAVDNGTSKLEGVPSKLPATFKNGTVRPVPTRFVFLRNTNDEIVAAVAVFLTSL